MFRYSPLGLEQGEGAFPWDFESWKLPFPGEAAGGCLLEKYSGRVFAVGFAFDTGTSISNLNTLCFTPQGFPPGGSTLSPLHPA